MQLSKPQMLALLWVYCEGKIVPAERTLWSLERALLITRGTLRTWKAPSAWELTERGSTFLSGYFQGRAER